MKRWDLIVIGLGLAGLTAARTALARGARVLICGRGIGSLALFGNSIDLLGEIPPGADLEAGIAKKIAAEPGHPYARVGWTGIAAALTAFRELFCPPYAFAPVGEGNSLVPTGAGTLRPTYLLPITMTAGAGLAAEETLIVGLRGFRDFQENTVALHLRCRGVNIALPRYGLEGLSALALARLMDEPSFRESLGAAIRRQMAGERQIGLPAVLGLKQPATVLKTLESITGARIFEIPMLPPSIPGIRIFHRFREELIAKGATFLMGHPVAKAEIKNGRCTGIVVQNLPLSTLHQADQVILATGRFLGGGLQADRERISEPLFALPVHQPAGRGEWFRERFFHREAHPVHSAGILTDARLRPRDEKGKVLLANVRVAGSILAHHQAIDEHSREGIDIATGFRAAEEALAP
ncbi:MAG: anaerobic glycerol-3-phosphate dehydrogenase subunit GlpB [Deltaproteobacteria bacterium]|nr:anaerobic glycerol-3-phosphate dehydrogenase subunit GlpB [Deltaproteobacteria bacterium]